MAKVTPEVHVLHIAKTGGTTLHVMLKQHKIRRTADRRPLIVHNHKTTLADVLARHRKNQAVFFLRDPLARFVSGFNSRLREGQPQKHVAWKPEEAVAFTYFSNANDLAEALSSNRQLVQDRAYFAFGALPHARNRYTYYFQNPEYLSRRIDRVAFIGFQETYADDVKRLFSVLGVGDEVSVLHLHQAPATDSTDLSRRATRNLRRWFADDIALYEWAWSQRDRFSAERSVALSRADEIVDADDADEAHALGRVAAIPG